MSNQRKLVEIHAREMRDITIPSDLGRNLNYFGDMKIPAGNAPQGYEQIEGLSLEQLSRIMAYIAITEGLVPSPSKAGNEILVTQIPITETTIRIEIPRNRYSIVEPIVLCTVIGGVTEVDIKGGLEYIDRVGEVFTYITLTFPAALIGKRCNVWLSGGY